jgi:diguanylate cyclase (GGDEF)-like protein
MDLDIALNIFFGSFLIIALVLADCISKYSADQIQKKIFCVLLAITITAILSDSLCNLLEGAQGFNRFLYGITFIYYVSQVLVYYFIFLFLDYMIFKDIGRVKKISFFICAVTIIHIIILLLNFKWHFYYYIDGAENIFHRGDKYIIRIIISYCSIPFILYEVIMAYRKLQNRNYFIAIILFLVISVSGSLLDITYTASHMIWPCLAAALLYFYFFIIQTDTRIDSLTGIGNRYSFGEFTDWLSHRSTGEKWIIFLLDMDHFKSINDTLGHQEGDNALRDMAQIIKKCIKGSDFAARYGGDEFVLATKTENDSTDLMERIQSEVQKHNDKNFRPFKIEISYGSDIYTADGNLSIDDFLNHIDGLMYKQKERRRRSGDRKPGETP